MPAKTLTTADIEALIEKVIAICPTCRQPYVPALAAHACRIWE